MLRDLFKPKEKNVSPSSDRFKSLIHTLSAMTDTELDKVEKLINLVFDQKQQENQVHPSEPVSPVIQEESLDDRIEIARATLKTEELEKRIEQFKQSKK
ncbi:hypothetical protein [Streptococcus acidominimus]|uniref:ATPases with chaperone activity, ATP-binding subunit n=1 Tax=Streptococcus acidominimus TaxID=1326 RepID=A0A1Q8E7N2_STRAI|nr:hypothetical protein [Streptococcus acidominimus]OLF47793.1 hypothetical protein BU200_10015 [Streptococcus acidominimus]SUN08027.1 ATPases with chaperone activity, ATP-binding subunit [Streptococcus acidominimus]